MKRSENYPKDMLMTLTGYCIMFILSIPLCLIQATVFIFTGRLHERTSWLMNAIPEYFIEGKPWPPFKKSE